MKYMSFVLELQYRYRAFSDNNNMPISALTTNTIITYFKKLLQYICCEKLLQTIA